MFTLADKLLATVEKFRIHFQIARTAIDGTTLRRVKRNGCVTIASGTINGDLNSLLNADGLRGGNRSDSFIFGLFAFPTAFGRVLQTFVAEKSLFADRPNKIAPAINTQNIYIYKICTVGASLLIELIKIVSFNL
jgi:hypothetical protein